jgi:hypothetical protein
VVEWIFQAEEVVKQPARKLPKCGVFPRLLGFVEERYMRLHQEFKDALINSYNVKKEEK